MTDVERRVEKGEGDHKNGNKKLKLINTSVN